MRAAQHQPIEAVRGRDEKGRPVGEARRPCQGSAPGGESGAVPMAMVSSSGDVAVRQEHIWGACLDERCAKSPQFFRQSQVDNSMIFKHLSSMGATVMAKTSTIEMQDRELFAAMAMQALITRGEGWAADMIAKQAVAYADALVEVLAATAPNAPDESPGFTD
jgi:hypothetical protein